MIVYINECEKQYDHGQFFFVRKNYSANNFSWGYITYLHETVVYPTSLNSRKFVHESGLRIKFREKKNKVKTISLLVRSPFLRGVSITLPPPLPKEFRLSGYSHTLPVNAHCETTSRHGSQSRSPPLRRIRFRSSRTSVL